MRPPFQRWTTWINSGSTLFLNPISLHVFLASSCMVNMQWFFKFEDVVNGQWWSKTHRQRFEKIGVNHPLCLWAPHKFLLHKLWRGTSPRVHSGSARWAGGSALLEILVLHNPKVKHSPNGVNEHRPAFHTCMHTQPYTEFSFHFSCCPREHKIKKRKRSAKKTDCLLNETWKKCYWKKNKLHCAPVVWNFMA